MRSLNRLAIATFAAAALILIASAASADPPLGVEAYVQLVLRSHPSARQVAAFELAASAEHKASRQIPDPSVAFSWDRARLPDGAGPSFTETGFSVSQTIPWPGTFKATSRSGERAAEALRAQGVDLRWELEIEATLAFARLQHARAALEIARAAEADALSLRELTARRAELGESREADRIKTEVEWLRQQRMRRADERGAEAAEEILRTLAAEPLPRPLALAGELPRSVPATSSAALRERLARSNPRLLAARAASERDAELVSAAGRARIPDLDVTWFHEKEIDKHASGFTFGIRVPLWNAGRGEIARAQATSASSAAGAERALLDLTTALERAREELDTASGQADILEREILPAATRSLELARFSYQEGETSLLDLLDSQRTLRETEREAMASRLALALALADVRRLVGPDFGAGR